MLAGLELRLSPENLKLFGRLTSGHEISVKGHASKKGSEAQHSVQLKIQRTDKHVVFIMQADAMEAIMRGKLCNYWCCELADVVQDNHVITPENQSVTECDKTTVKRKRDNYLESSLNGEHLPSLQRQSTSIEQSSTENELESPMSFREISEVSEQQSFSVEFPENDINSNVQESGTESSLSEAKALNISQVDRRKSTKCKADLKLACKFCGRHFIAGNLPLNRLQRHIMKSCPKLHIRKQIVNNPTANNLFKCEHCQISVKTKYNLDRHLTTCAANPSNTVDLNGLTELYYCDNCNWPSLNEQDLYRHRVHSHGAPKKPKKPHPQNAVACRYCGEIFRYTASRRNHELFKCTKNINVTKSYFCRYCGRRFGKEALEKHLNEKHTKRKCICEFCGLEFNTRTSKYHHVVSAHKESPHRFQCTYCDKSYLQKRLLKSHMTKHFDEKRIQCSVCGKCFKNEEQERAHRRHLHEGRYQYHCKQCGHGVARLQYLNKHKCGRVRRIQDGEKQILKNERREQHSNEELRQSSNVANHEQEPDVDYLTMQPVTEVNNVHSVDIQLIEPPVSLPLVSLLPVSLPPVSLPLVSLPPVSLPLVSLPPVSLPLVSLPSVSLPPVSLCYDSSQMNLHVIIENQIHTSSSQAQCLDDYTMNDN